MQGCLRHAGERCGCSASEKAVGSIHRILLPLVQDQTGIDTFQHGRVPTLWVGESKRESQPREQMTANRIILLWLILLINVIE